METIKSYIVAGLMLMAGLMPAIRYSLPMDAKYWHWWVLMAGFLGFYTLFLKVPFIVKFVSVGSFVLCFFSSAPSISFTQYIMVAACCYFYILCISIKDYTFINKCLQCLLLFHLFFFFIQIFHKDALLNFGLTSSIANYGIVGQHMQSASFMVVLSAALLPFCAYNLITPFVTSALCNSAGGFISISVGALYYLSNKTRKRNIVIIALVLFSIVVVWMVVKGKFTSNLNFGENGGRLLVWIKSIKLSWEHPFVGYGIGTYKKIFPALCRMKSLFWKTAHNCWVQLICETGYVFSTVLFGYYFYLLKKLFNETRRKAHKEMAWKCIAGLLIIGVNMQFHFPSRMIQSVLIIIFFLAYCQKFINDGGVKNGIG